MGGVPVEGLHPSAAMRSRRRSPGLGPWPVWGMWCFAAATFLLGATMFALSWRHEASRPAPEWTQGWTLSFETTWWPGWWPLVWCALLLASMKWVASVKNVYGDQFYQTMAGPVLCISIMTLPPPLVVVVAVGMLLSKHRFQNLVYRQVAQLGFDCIWIIPLVVVVQQIAAYSGVLNWRALLAAALTAVGVEALPFALVKLAVQLETGRSPMRWRMAFTGLAMTGTHLTIAMLAVAIRDLGPFWMLVMLASVLTWQGILQTHGRMRKKIHDAEMERNSERTEVTRAILRKSETERTATMAALHDGVIQSLLVAKFQAELRKEELELNGEQSEAWDEMVAQLDEVGRELRALMRARGGPGAGHLDLPEALGEAMSLLPATLTHSVRVASLPAGADPGTQRAMYDIIRAGLDRVVENGTATRVEVIVEVIAPAGDSPALNGQAGQAGQSGSAGDGEASGQRGSGAGGILEARIVDDGEPLALVAHGAMTTSGQLGIAVMMEMAAARDGEVTIEDPCDELGGEPIGEPGGAAGEGGSGNLVRVRVPLGDASARAVSPLVATDEVAGAAGASAGASAGAAHTVGAAVRGASR